MFLFDLLQPLAPLLDQYGGIVLAWGWVAVVFYVFVIAWETYILIKQIDYVSAIQWTYLQIKLPEESPQTPKSMENVYDVLAGIHKDPDVIEKYFEGYFLAWYSCELHCEPHRARYIMVVPTVHRNFFEGVIYGQYPQAEVTEVEDYTQQIQYQDLERTYDMYGTELDLSDDDIYPLRSYASYEDTLAEDDKYVDPHQALVEAYTNLREGEQFWVQILVRPVSAGKMAKWSEAGEEEIAEISGQAKEKKPGFWKTFFDFFLHLPAELFEVFSKGAIEPPSEKKEQIIRPVYNPLDTAKMEAVLRKISRPVFRVKIRVIHIAPPGKLHKPAISLAIGVFKQFADFNSLFPDSSTKTNGPNYILKQSRRRFRKRRILLLFQWRDLWDNNKNSVGHMMNSEELATLYHFPVKYLKAPAVERATSGLGSAPENIPYV